MHKVRKMDKASKESFLLFCSMVIPRFLSYAIQEPPVRSFAKSYDNNYLKTRGLG
jgi:hypothetical protein